MAERSEQGERRGLAYLTWLARWIWLPEIALAAVAPRSAVKRWRLFALLSGVGLAAGVPWDLAGFRWSCWSLRDGAWLGRRLAGLPLEEWLFLVTAPWLFGEAALVGLSVQDAGTVYLSRARSLLRRTADSRARALAPAGAHPPLACPAHRRRAESRLCPGG